MNDTQTLANQQERLRVRAVELRRRQLILKNELESSGISEAEQDYIQQRLQILSNEEDAVGQELSQVEQQRNESERSQTELRQQQARTPLRFASRVQGPATVGQIRQLEQVARQYGRRREERELAYTQLAGQAKKTFILVIVFALGLAGVADILSIFDVGWIISWALPIATWFIARRINRINGSVRDITAAQQQTLGELRLIRQRLQPALAATGQAQLLAQAEAINVNHATGSYAITFVRDQIISQVLELIPIVDWLPMYLGGVVKLIIDQQRAYRKAKSTLAPYRHMLDLLDYLENFELQLIAAGLSIAGTSPLAPQPRTTRSIPTRLVLAPA